MVNANLDTFLTRLAHLGERLRTDSEALERVSRDESGLPPGRAAAAVWPASPQEVQDIAREAAALGIPLVPRGGGSGKAGACIPGAGEVVVDFTRMNQVLELRPADLYAVVQPGVITYDFEQTCRAEGFMFPPDPSGWQSSTLGGNIATNAGGPRAVKYGVTQRYVWGLTVVLPGGDVVPMGRRSIKGVAGFDLTSLMVGSEGTLGFIVQATLHIVPAPAAVETAWVSFASPRAASDAAARVFARGFVPSMLELLDDVAIEAVRPLVKVRFAQGAGAALLVEADGAEGEAMASLERMVAILTENGATESAIATNETQRAEMRRARRLVSAALKERFPHKISDDVAVPRSRMPEVLERAKTLAGALGVVSSAYGHLGDGNVHVNFLCQTPEQREAAQSARRLLMTDVIGLGGTITGEHGIGLTKRDQLPLEHGPELLALQRRVERAFDPAGIMNPGKVLR